MRTDEVRAGSTWSAGAVLVMVVCAGCTTADSPDSLAGLGIDDGASRGQSTSALVSAEQGATLELATGARLIVPSGAVDEEVELGLERPADAQAVKLANTVKAGAEIASAPYVLTPHGIEFERDVELTLPIASGRDAKKLVVAWLSDEDDESWQTLGVPETSGDKATFRIKHFSVLILLESDEAADAPDLGGDTDASLDAGRDASDAPEPTDGSTEPGRDASSDASTDAAADAETDPQDAAADADAAPDACVPATTCADAIARAGGDACGTVSDGCADSLYCPDACDGGDYCDQTDNTCKPSVCGTSCAGLPAWEAYCDHDGVGAYCFPGDPAWSCDEGSAECTEDGACVQCDGKCISDAEGCDPNTVRVIGTAGGTIEDEVYGDVVVPAGAAAADTEFYVVMNPEFGVSGFAPHMPSPYSDYGTNCFGPYHQTFAQPLTVHIQYHYSPPQTPSSVVIYKLDDQDDTTWTLVAAQITAPSASGESYSATVETTTLGCYGLGVSFD